MSEFCSYAIDNGDGTYRCRITGQVASREELNCPGDVESRNRCAGLDTSWESGFKPPMTGVYGNTVRPGDKGEPSGDVGRGHGRRTYPLDPDYPHTERDDQ